jgi:hypothetical protein
MLRQLDNFFENWKKDITSKRLVQFLEHVGNERKIILIQDNVNFFA